MKQKIILIIIIISALSSGRGFAQTQKLDSLKLVLADSKSPEAKVNMFNLLAHNSYYYSPDTTKKWATQALTLSTEINYERGQALAHRYIGLTEEIHGNFDESLIHFNKTVDFARLINDSTLLALAIKNVGNIYRKQSKLNEMLAFYQASMLISEKLGDSLALSNALINVAIAYKLMGDYPNALNTYQQSMLIKEIFMDSTGLGIVYQGMGNLYQNLTEYDLALDYMEKSLAIKIKQNNKIGAAITYGNIGGVLIEMEKNEDAIVPLLKSLQLKKSLKQSCGLTYPLNSLGKAYYGIGEIDTAFTYLTQCILISEECRNYITFVHSMIYLGKIYKDRNQINLAEKHFRKAYEIARNASTKELLEASHELMEFYKFRKFYKKAFEFSGIYMAIKDSVFNEENTKKITRLESKFEFEKEKQLLVLEQERTELTLKAKISKQRSFVIIALITISLGLIIVIILYISYQGKTRANIKLSSQNTVIKYQSEQLEISSQKEQKLLQEKLDTQQRELASLAMQSNESNNMLNNLKAKIGKIELTSSNKVQIKEIEKTITQHTNKDSSWDSFVHKFETVYPDFFKHLKIEFEKLTVNELKLCGYIKIGMNNNEIMQVTNTAASTIKKNINVLKKKLSLGAIDSVRDYLIKYE